MRMVSSVFDMPSSVLANNTALKSTVDFLVDCFIGFVKLEGRNASFVGSGTLVSVGNTKAILTADHVLEALPETGPVGVALPTRFDARVYSPKIQMDYVRKVRVGRGEEEAKGPDLGLLILPEPVSSLIPSSKTFYNLTKRRMKVLNSPLPFETCTWVLSGVPAEWTKDVTPEAGFAAVKGFHLTTGFGVVSKECERNDFDYLEFVAKYSAAYEGPNQFGGYSGGGLWHVPLDKERGQIIAKDRILSGVAFWQSPIVGDERTIRCHGRKSIYQRVIGALSL